MKRLLAACFAVLAAHAAAPFFQTTIDGSAGQWTAVRGVAAPDGSVKHGSAKSVRVEPAGASDAVARSLPVSLVIGKRYELSAWVRTESLAVRDLNRSPIATGAALTMASMPFDVHSSSLGGSKPWTHLTLRFVATRAQDQVLLTVGLGGAAQGKAWFDSVSLNEIPFDDEWPTRDAVRTYGPAYRYPYAGWIYLHIEGKPYERGYQHGYLMAHEIPLYLARCASELGGTWDDRRTVANALFLRGFDREILEEMNGIAQGASDAGARFQGRAVDLLDIVVVNVTVEMGELSPALNVTKTGLEGLSFDKPSYSGGAGGPAPATDHCSAFAATGPATRDGKMVMGHVTWWPLTLAEQTNVWLDIKPESGHRMLIQSYPGGIESGTDWYQNDAGMILSETTIAQTPFDAQGTPVAFRAREAIQYAANIDEMVARLGTRNNGLYTNEWLMGDAKTNEIAMYELGTHVTKLWRSSRNEWFGDTPGFYWGDNNAKDLAVRLERRPDLETSQGYAPYSPEPRDLAWQDLYHKYKGQIDEQFAFTAYRTAPLVSASTMDAKVASADMANRMMVWAAIGKPNQREWLARGGYSGNDGLYPSGYALFRAEPSDALLTNIRSSEGERLAGGGGPASPATTGGGRRGGGGGRSTTYSDRLWQGVILPASPADDWFVAGASAYRQALQSGDIDRALTSRKIQYRGLKLGPDNAATRFSMEGIKGELFLDSLRRKMGDDRFLALMRDFFKTNAGKVVTAQAFLNAAGTAFEFTEPEDGAAYTVGDIRSRLATALIVYGTVREAGANRYAAEQLQSRYLDSFENSAPIYKDFEASDELLNHHDVIFIGRPETNSALAEWSAKLGLEYSGASFKIDGATHASEREALLFAAKNPLDAAHMVLVLAGNDALRTVKAINEYGQDPYVVYEDGGAASAPAGGRGGRGGR